MRTFAQQQNQPQEQTSSSFARSNRATSGPHRADHTLHLQRAIGNQVLQRMLQTDAEELETGTASPRFGHDFSRIPIHSPAAGAIQTKRTINQPKDDNVREADHVAVEVMRTPEPQLQRACPCGGRCPRCKKEQLSHDHERLQPERVGSSDSEQTTPPPIVHQLLRSFGQPVERLTRASSESRFGYDSSQVHADIPQTMQAKLVVGQPGDIYEQEADEIATTIMGMPDPQAVEGHVPTAMQAVATRHNRLSGRHEVRRQPSDLIFGVPEEEEFLQTKAVSGHTPELAPGFEEQLNAIEGRAQPFPPSLRAFFEPRFGYDLSSVRVHTDAWAHQMARAVHARAFTLGRHIVFGEGYYAPTTSEGQHLLAHELTHTIQQGAVRQGSVSSNPSSTTPPTGSDVPKPSVRTPSTTQFMLQKAACNFYVHDSTEPTALGTAWAVAAHTLAKFAYGGYRVPSGDSIEEMLHRVLSVYAAEDCDCIEEIQFLSHGSSGNAMYISKTGDELTISDFNIPELEKYGDGPRNTPAYQAWYDKLSFRQRRLVLLRRILCGPGAEVYYRSCEAFQGKTGQEFAKASAAFWRAKVIGHTKVIALTQPGQKVLKPGQEPYWPESEGTGAPSPKKPVGIGATQKPKKD